MSARKAAHIPNSKPVTLVGRESRLSLSHDEVVFHRGGIEFRCEKPYAAWTELTLTLESPIDHRRMHCNGVVISCTGNKHTGYHVSMVFTSLSRHGMEVMQSIAAQSL